MLVTAVQGQGADVRRELLRDHVHQQTGLSTGAVADDDELTADFSHCVCCVWGAKGGRGTVAGRKRQQRMGMRL